MHLHTYLVKRAGQTVVVLFGLSVLVFFLDRISGSPAASMLPRTATNAEVRALSRELGWNKPLIDQYLSYVGGVFHGNLGQSYHWQISVTGLIGGRLPATLELIGAAMAIALLIALPLGVLGARKPGKLGDGVVQTVSIIGISTPAYWVGLILILIFAVHWKIFPATGRGPASSVVLPAVTLSLGITGQLTRITRAVMIDVLGETYMVAARSKGLSSGAIYVRHALRNAAPPIITYVGLALADLVGGAVIIETIFAWPGLGQLSYQALEARDYPLVQGIALCVGAAIVFINLVVDLSYAVVNPKIRSEM